MSKQSRQKSIRIDHSVRLLGDTHFSHPLMIAKRDQGDGTVSQFRKFETMQEHDDYLVDAWNERVKPSQTVFHLGDFGFWKAPVEDLENIFKRLNGRKFLIPGNHDSAEVERFGWEGVLHGPVHLTDHDGQKIILNHHPLREWDGWHNGSLHYHGHTHNNLPSSRRSMDIGVDSIGYWPLSSTEIRSYMAQLPELSFRGVEVDDFAPDAVADEESMAP
jgi:calcineurin-like phosphoesterase family protein